MDGSAETVGEVFEATASPRLCRDPPDSRPAGKVIHPPAQLPLLASLASPAGAETFTGIARFVEGKLALLRRCRPFRDSTPPHERIGEIFAALDATRFRRCFIARVAAVTGMWVPDFTDVATWQGFVHLGFVIGARARRILGRRVSRGAQATFVLDAPEQALPGLRPIGGGLAHHSAGGVQYVSIRYTGRLAQAGIAPALGGVGDGADNAPAASIIGIGLSKAEVIRRAGPRRRTEAGAFASLEWVACPDHRRPLEPNGFVPPAGAEADHHAARGNPALAA